MRGYSSELYMVPEEGVGFYVVYNRDFETGPPARLREALTDFLYETVLPEPAVALRAPAGRCSSCGSPWDVGGALRRGGGAARMSVRRACSGGSWSGRGPVVLRGYDRIDWLEAEGNYVRIHTYEKTVAPTRP